MSIHGWRRWATASVFGAAACLPQPALAQEGRIVGRVINGKTGEPLANAQVYIEESREGATLDGTLSALDGRYVLRRVAAGIYAVTAQLIGFATKSVTDVEVAPGQTAILDVSLEEAAIELDEITVTSVAERSSNTALLTERRIAVVVSDAIGAEQITRSPDGDAAAALRRVPGVSVVDGKYAYVRGLGERYSATTLNGAPLASPEPDKKVIPLDVFPSGLLESIVTSKSYSPDQPGDYAGGLVQLRTQDFPANRILSISTSAGWSSVATFENRLGYRGGGTDFFGFDDGTRELPGSIPRNARVSGAGFDAGTLQAMGRSFRGDWGPTMRKLPLNTGLSVSFGDDFDLGGEQRAGFIASASYSSDFAVRSDLVERVFSASGAADPEVDYRGEVSERSVTLGGLLDFTYQPRPTDRIKIAAIYTHAANDASRVLSGFNLDSNTNQWNSRIQFLEQALLNAQLEGQHLFARLGGATVHWRGAYTRASRYEPSTRESLYREFQGQFLWDDFIQSGSVFHQDVVDDGFNGGVSLQLPLETNDVPASLTFGGAFETKARTAYTRRFRFRPRSGGTIDSEVRALTPNQLFGSPGTYIEPNGFEIQEATFRTDNYDAEQDVQAGYVMVDFGLLGGSRLSGGARVEHSVQEVTPLDLWATGLPQLEGADLESTAILPAINLTLQLSNRVSLRGGASRTLARPQLRELAPFSYADYAGGYLVLGNPELEGTRISNFDLRLEWFPSVQSVFAVSMFYKRFDQPIEVAVLPSSELIKTWVNGAGGDNYGAEIEARSSLDVIDDALGGLTLNGNLTLVRSAVETGGVVDAYLPGTGATKLAVQPRERALQGQSPYVANVGLSWAFGGTASASVLLNRFGRRIDAVSAEALPDIYEEARSQLDVAFEWPLARGWRAKLSASRLIGNEVEFTQGGGLLRSYDLGRSVSFGLSWGAGR